MLLKNSVYKIKQSYIIFCTPSEVIVPPDIASTVCSVLSLLLCVFTNFIETNLLLSLKMVLPLNDIYRQLQVHVHYL